MLKTHERNGRYELPVVDAPAARRVMGDDAAPVVPKSKRVRKPSSVKRNSEPANPPRTGEIEPASTAQGCAVEAPTVADQTAALPTGQDAALHLDPEVKRWAQFGVAFMLTLSAGLNGYANSLHAPTEWAGWLMGVSVPVIVLTLAKVAGGKWRKGERGTGGFAGGSGAGLLILSVWHCSESIALLTGSGLLLAVPMAVAIDAGLVACELALITEPRTAR